MLEPVSPIMVRDKFPALQYELIYLLGQLPAAAWAMPTAVPGWTVQDVTAHLLDTMVRRVTFGRDQQTPLAPTTPVEDYAGLVRWVNQLNADWIHAARRISPPLLIDFLVLTGDQLHAYFKRLDLYAMTGVGVAWAGEDRSPVWFDLAREYTEQWHHQQHIREAVGAPLLTERTWLFPVLDTFVRGLPHALRDLAAPPATQIGLELTGAAGGQWTLVRNAAHWQLLAGATERNAARVALDADTAWRLFTRGLAPEIALQRAELSGAPELARPLFDHCAIIA